MVSLEKFFRQQNGPLAEINIKNTSWVNVAVTLG
jgi:hypothetical protein